MGRLAVVIFFLLGLLLSARAEAEEEVRFDNRGEVVASLALLYEGYPYLWGGLGPEAFDCAGLAIHVYRLAGFDLETTYLPALAVINPVLDGSVLAGDLLFFENTYKPGISHVAIALEGGRFVHAAGPEWGVIVSDLDRPYWRERLSSVSRPWRE